MYSYGSGVESSKTKQTVLIIEFETLSYVHALAALLGMQVSCYH